MIFSPINLPLLYTLICNMPFLSGLITYLQFSPLILPLSTLSLKLLHFNPSTITSIGLGTSRYKTLFTGLETTIFCAKKVTGKNNMTKNNNLILIYYKYFFFFCCFLLCFFGVFCPFKNSPNASG